MRKEVSFELSLGGGRMFTSREKQRVSQVMGKEAGKVWPVGGTRTARLLGGTRMAPPLIGSAALGSSHTSGLQISFSC